MQITPAISGIYPRSEELIGVCKDFKRGRATKDALESAYRKDAESVIVLQRELGFPYITDGQMRWHDLSRPFTRRGEYKTQAEEESRFGSFEGNGLANAEASEGIKRWFETNTFYRPPVIRRKIIPEDQDIIHNYCDTTSVFHAGIGMNLSALGPYTFMRLSQNEHYARKEDLMIDYARILNDIGLSVPELLFHLHEPSFLYDEEIEADLDAVREAYASIFSGPHTRTVLTPYYGRLAPLFGFLASLGTTYVSIDNMTEASDIPILDHGRYAFTVTDSTNSAVEDPEEIVKHVRHAAGKLGGQDILLTNSKSMHFVPEKIARAKLTALAEAARRLKE